MTYSWIHHWVWIAPLLVYLGDLALCRCGIVAPLGLVAAFLVASGGVFDLIGLHYGSVFDLPNRGLLALFDHNAYIWLTLALFAVTALWLRRAEVSKHRNSALETDLISSAN